MGIVFDQSLNTTDSPSFVDGDFSGDINVTSGSYIRRDSIAHLRFGSRLTTYIELSPSADNTYPLGVDGNRWSGVASVDGSFSGNLTNEVGSSYKIYNLGTDGDTDTEYLEIEGDAPIGYYKIQPKHTGAGSATQVLRLLAVQGSHISLYAGGQFAYTHVGVQHLYCTGGGVRITDLDVTGDGSFSGNLNSEVGGSIRHYSTGTEGDTDTSFIEMGDDGTRHTIYTTQTGAGAFRNLRIGNTAHYMEVIPTSTKIDWYISGVKKFTVASTSVQFKDNLFPISGLVPSLGSDSLRWLGVYAQDGSFTGTLDTEVGGSNRIFNLGSDADVAAGDTEYIETSWDTNECVIRPKYTGTGTFRGLKLQAALDNRGFLTINSTGSISLGYNTTSNFIVQSGETRFGADIFPATSNTHTLGEAARRWSNVASVDGSFSSTLDTEVGGSNRLFNLGSDGDIAAGDTEYLEIAVESNRFSICPKTTGAGVLRELILGTTTDTITTKFHGTLIPYDSNSNISMSGSVIEFGSKAGFRHNTGSASDAGGCLEVVERFSSGVGRQWWAYDGSIHFLGDGVTEPCDVKFNITNTSAGETDYERVRFSYSGTKAQLFSEAGGTGTSREFRIGTSGGYQVFLGTAGQGSALGYNGIPTAYWTTGALRPYGAGKDLGARSPNPDSWALVGAVDGSFSGTLDVEVGGSYKLYNLGTDGDADTEYLEIYHNGSDFVLDSKATGAGTAQSVSIGRSGAMSVIHSGSGGSKFRSIIPQVTGTYSCGILSLRWANVFSVDGDFSGSLTTAGLTTGIQTVTIASDTLVDTDHTTLCDCTSNTITINLPTAVAGLRYEIKKIDASANAVTIDGNASETIDGALTATLTTQYESITIVSDGTNWFIVD